MEAPLQAHALVLAAAALAMLAVVLLHFEGMALLGRRHATHRRRSEAGRLGRYRLLGMIVGLITLHLLSIAMFGAAFWLLLQADGTGTLRGARPIDMFDAFYLSAVTYSTVGFGDLVPAGPIRWLAGVEALVGLMMVAWSASFAYLEMSRHWRDDVDGEVS